MGMEYIAHVKRVEDGSWKVHLLEEHLTSVAKLSEGFSQKFGADIIGKLCGLWHDLGKYKQEFQERIRLKSGYSDYDEEAHLEGKTAQSVKHAISGGLFAIDTLGQAGLFLSFPIVGHHTGLKNLNDLKRTLNDTKEKKALSEFKPSIPSLVLGSKITLPRLQFSDHALLIRMLFSALIDADRLDTENFMNPETAKYRNRNISSYHLLQELNQKLDKHLDSFKQDSHINTQI